MNKSIKLISIFCLLVTSFFSSPVYAGYATDGFSRADALKKIGAKLFNIDFSLVDGSTGILPNFKNDYGLNDGLLPPCFGYDGGHSGIDIQTKDVAGTATADREFYSLTNGVVLAATPVRSNAIAVFDDAANKTTIYLHARTVFVKIGDRINVGARLGIQGNSGLGYSNTNSSEHVHVEVRTGNTPAAACGASSAIDPVDYLYDESKGGLVPLSFIDGAGSLVDPGNNKDCISNGNFGCSKDTVRLHPHSTSSTALFQVLKQYGQCDYVRVSGLKEAYISVKGWSEQYPGETGLGNSAIYKADALPADIPLTNSDWSIIAVTTTVPIPANSIRDINLECVGGFGIQSWQLKKLTADISSASNAVARKLSTQGGYSWGGNGSLITFSNNQIINDTRSNYGRYRDVAKTISGVNAGTVAVFQVYNSPTYACNKLIINNSLVNSSATISWKSWAKATWTGVSTKLPYTLLLNGSDYSIIKIEGNFNASNLNATCSP